MNDLNRIEAALDSVLLGAEAGCPPRLAAAMRHAVFPGGARVRPRLMLAITDACGAEVGELALAAAVAIELLHCASLAHDDLPCFDNAATRRGLPSVPAAFGAGTAVLAGDALIVLAFETIGRAGAAEPGRLAPVLAAVAAGVGAPSGIVAGQAWEEEGGVVLEAYHRAKTGALFVASAVCGALTAGRDPAPWRIVGERLGEAYQVADDLMDAVAGQEEGGKPVGQDAVHGRPNAVLRYGLAGALERLQRLVEAAAAAVPPCPGAAELRELVRMQAQRLAPKQLALSAA